jgi:hypothetical protein
VRRLSYQIGGAGWVEGPQLTGQLRFRLWVKGRQLTLSSQLRFMMEQLQFQTGQLSFRLLVVHVPLCGGKEDMRGEVPK